MKSALLLLVSMTVFRTGAIVYLRQHSERVWSRHRGVFVRKYDWTRGTIIARLIIIGSVLLLCHLVVEWMSKNWAEFLVWCFVSFAVYRLARALPRLARMAVAEIRCTNVEQLGRTL